MICGYKLKTDVGCIIVIFRSVLEIQGRGKSFPMGKAASSAHSYLLCGGGRAACKFLGRDQWPRTGKKQEFEYRGQGGLE